MLNHKMGGSYLSCNKCHSYICKVNILGIKQLTKMEVKRHYCGDCILKRLEKYADKKGCKYVF